jgi:hypothetical protein
MTTGKPAASQRPRRKATTQRRTPTPPASVRSGIRPAVDPKDVRLERGTGGAGRGGGPGGGFWHIYVSDTRAGSVYINMIDEPPIGKHASIQIRVNQTWQGRGVGRVAYRLASEASDHNTVYAHMRKSNLASRASATHAGYLPIEDESVRQLIMVWKRPSRRR